MITLFMPDFVKKQTKGFTAENFEYRNLPAIRFIGFEGEKYTDVDKRIEAMGVLDAMMEYRSGFDYDIFFMHHFGEHHYIENSWHGVWGRFIKENTPVPEGYLSIDFVPHDVCEAGPPYYSQFAFAKFSGDINKLHSREGFDVNAMYDVTRNIVLGDGANIPYPEKYWTAEVFFNGCDNPGTGYLFSTGRPHPERQFT